MSSAPSERSFLNDHRTAIITALIAAVFGSAGVVTAAVVNSNSSPPPQTVPASPRQDQVPSQEATGDAPLTDTPIEATESPGDNDPTPATAEARVRHQSTDVTLAAEGDYISLDAPASDPTWGATEQPTHPGIFYYHGDVNFMGVATLKTDQVPSFRQCASSTGYSAEPYRDALDLVGGGSLCLRTDEGRFGSLRVKSASDTVVVMEIVTWETV